MSTHFRNKIAMTHIVDWATLKKSIGTTSSYVKFGNLLIQWGKIKGLKYTSNTTITMPQSFANTNYTLVVTNEFDEGGQSFWWAFPCTKAVNSFTARGGFKSVDTEDGYFNVDNICNWVALGQSAS